MQMTNFEYNLLFLFKICVDCGSFSKASQELNVKQPAISYNIKKLEDLLDVKLFNRTKSGIELTEEGRILYDYVKEANNSIVSGLNVLDEINSKEIRQLNVGVTLNLAIVYLPNVLEKFHELFPDVKVTIETVKEEQMLAMLQEKKLDIVIFNSSKYIPIKGLNVRKVKTNEVVCVGTKKFKDMIENNPKTELVVPLLLPNNESSIAKVLTIKLDAPNVVLKNIIKCTSAVLARELLLKGMGIGYINKATVKKEIDNKELYVLANDSNVDIYSINIATQLKNNNIAIQEFKKIFLDEVNK